MSAKKLAKAKNLYEYQMKLASYKNNKVPNYTSMVRNSRALLYNRVLRSSQNVNEKSKVFATQIANGVNAESSPRRLFEALQKLNRLKTAPKTLAKDTMVEDLAKSRTFSNYGKKMLKYQGQKNYAQALVKAKALVAERVRARYMQLTKAQRNEVDEYVDIRAATNKASSPAVMFNALEEMRRFRDPMNQSWRFI
jgi:hypothetical protein